MSSDRLVSFDQFKRALPALLVLFVYLLTYHNAIVGLIRVWGNSEDNSHGFLIVPIFIYMLWQKKDQLIELPVEGSNLGGAFFFASLLLYVVAKAGGILTLVSVSVWLSFVSGAWFMFGTRFVRAIVFPLFFLLFMLPVPTQIYAAVTGPLQLYVSKVACYLLTFSGVPIYCQGNVIEHPDKVFQVVQACSGLRSIMTMLTLGAIVAYFAIKNYWLRGLLILVGIPVALLVNIFRVYVLVGLYDWMQLDLTHGVAHTILGLLVFVLSLALFFLAYKGCVRWDH